MKLAASWSGCVEEVLNSHSYNWLLLQGTQHAHPAGCAPHIDLKYYSQTEELGSSIQVFHKLCLVWVIISNWISSALGWILAWPGWKWLVESQNAKGKMENTHQERGRCTAEIAIYRQKEDVCSTFFSSTQNKRNQLSCKEQRTILERRKETISEIWEHSWDKGSGKGFFQLFRELNWT